MKTRILNREFQHPADGWYQIEAKGNHLNKASKVIQVIDDEAITSIVNRFNEEAKAGKLRHINEMLIDHEHFSSDADKETIAYGWLQELQAREDGIYGRIRWTATGKPAVDGGDYRFFSTEYDRDDLKVLNSDGKNKRCRPLRLDGLTLTNMNNNRGQKPITNREGIPPGEEAEAGKPKQRNNMKSVALELGLAAEASEEAILAAVKKLKGDADKGNTENPQLQNRIKVLTDENKGLLDEQVLVCLDAHGVKDEKVRNRLKPVLAGCKNREERIEVLKDFGFDGEAETPAAGAQPTQRKLTNREGAQPGKGAGAEDEAAQAEKAQAEIETYRVTNRCTYEQARNAVRRTKPELFGLKK